MSREPSKPIVTLAAAQRLDRGYAKIRNDRSLGVVMTSELCGRYPRTVS